jgi:hypothetical protein
MKVKNARPDPGALQVAPGTEGPYYQAKPQPLKSNYYVL